MTTEEILKIKTEQLRDSNKFNGRLQKENNFLEIEKSSLTKEVEILRQHMSCTAMADAELKRLGILSAHF